MHRKTAAATAGRSRGQEGRVYDLGPASDKMVEVSLAEKAAPKSPSPGKIPGKCLCALSTIKSKLGRAVNTARV